VVSWLMLENGWTFDKATARPATSSITSTSCTSATPPIPRLHRARHRAGAVGQELKRIVSNESAEIIRMFNSAFDG
jgi:putative glutathione S-transferase